MRKLSTIHLKDAEVLNETQLKQICGGSGAVAMLCSTDCTYKEAVYDSNGNYHGEKVFTQKKVIMCYGTCTATNEREVTCTEPAIGFPTIRKCTDGPSYISSGARY